MMTQLASTLLIFLAIALFLLVWGWTVVHAYRFVWRREPSVLDRMFWLALVIVLPVIGYAIFRIAFSLDRALLTDGAAEGQPARLTYLRRPAGVPGAPSAAQPDGIWLTAVSGPARGKQVWVAAFPAVIGRGAEAVMRLDADSAVSRLHAELAEQDGSLLLRDLESRHGTRVNGKPIKEAKIKPGDQIEIGSTTILIQPGRTG